MRAVSVVFAATTAIASSAPSNYPTPLLPPVLLADAPRPERLVVADFDNDGKADVVTEGYDNESNYWLKVYYQATPGFFRAPVLHSLPASYPYGFATGDLDGDGRLDVTVAYYGKATIFYQGSQGQLSRSQDIAIGDEPRAQVLVADIERDGLNDVIVSYGSGVRIYYQQPPPGLPPLVQPFQRSVQIPAQAPMDDMRVVDIDSDGDLDIAWATAASGAIGVARQNADGSFAAEAVYGPTLNGRGIAMGDLNGDGKLDAVVSGGDFNHSLAVLHQDPDGGFTLATTLGYGCNAGVAISDFDGDGRADVACAVSGYSRMYLFTRTDDGGFADGRMFPVPVSRGLAADGFGRDALAAADVSSDGKPDIVLADAVEGQVVWFNSLGNVPTADLTVTVVADPNVREVKTDRVFTMTVSNAGPDAMNDVVVYDLLPGIFEVVSVDPRCSVVQSDFIECSLGDLPAGSSEVITFIAQAWRSQAFAGADYTNWSAVFAREIDYFPDNDQTALDVRAENLYHAGSITFEQPSYVVDRHAGEIRIPVRRVGGDVDRTETQFNVTGTAGYLDYQGTGSASLGWGHGDSATQYLTFQILETASPQPDKTFSITLFQSGLAGVGPITTTTITIHDPAYSPEPPFTETAGGGGGGALPLPLLLTLLAGLGMRRRDWKRIVRTAKLPRWEPALH